jgi:SAM-dependent methyltransferase
MAPTDKEAAPHGIDCISKEKSSHGDAWRSVHGSYFADPGVARPLVDDVLVAFGSGRPDTVADIGGGTGFVLSELLRRKGTDGIRMVNVDASQEQLEACHGTRLERVCSSVMELDRGDLVAESGRLFLVSRSVLHYFGREGQSAFLSKMRSLLRPGELFVHQPACFATPDLCGCMNEIYPLMGVDKCYYTPSELEEMHRRAGFGVARPRPGPPLDLRSEDLAARYHLGPERVEELCCVVRRYGLDRAGVFKLGPSGFRTAFTYRILTLRAR